MSVPASALAGAVATLRNFVKALARRKDIIVHQKRLGRPAPARLVAYHRQHPELLPAELVDLYELMNGADVEWSFIGAPGGGALHISALGGDYQIFEPDDTYGDNFGPGKVSLFFDQQQPEFGTWLVADGPADIPNARLLFADQGEGDAGTLAAGSIAEYLRRAVVHGLASHWPAPDADVAETLDRLAAPSAPRARIRPGMRVHITLFAEGGRAEVVDLHPVTDPELLARYSYALRALPQLALLRLDLGLLLWIPVRHMRPIAQAPDAYERLHADPWQLLRLAETDGWRAARRLFTLVCDPASSQLAEGRVVAALLRPLPLAEAVALTQALALGFYSVEDTPYEPWVLTEAEQQLAMNRPGWRRFNWESPWELTLNALFKGLHMRFQLEPPHDTDPATTAALDYLKRTLTPHYPDTAHYINELRKPRRLIDAAHYGHTKPGFPTTYLVADI